MKRSLKKIENYIIEHLNNHALRTKLMFLFITCVIIPVILVDGVVFALIMRADNTNRMYEMQRIAETVAMELEVTIDKAEVMANRVYVNQRINDFLETDYESPIEYYDAYQEIRNSILSAVTPDDFSLMIYSSNETIVNGGSFFNLKNAAGSEWLEKIENSEREGELLFYYDAAHITTPQPNRTLSYIRKLSFFKRPKYEKYVKCNINYNAIVRNLMNMRYDMPVYVCSGDKILFTNTGHSTITNDFEVLTGNEEFAYEYPFSTYGYDMKVCIIPGKASFSDIIGGYLPIIIPLVILSILLPMILMLLISKSFSERLGVLNNYFSDTDIDHLKKIETIHGNDEIARLMSDYNRMVDRSNELIQTAYKSRIDRQEGELARQKAELLALQSQINPHFLFNTLESIRMHSVIKNEDETADVLAKLSVLVRKNVEWATDSSRVSDEISFIRDYLSIQKYRFGDRLSYNIDAQETCMDYIIPNLSLVTFVENACVHGMEGKSGLSEVNIKVYENDGWLCLETDDTGMGMDEDVAKELKEMMNDISIDMIMESRHVGILNACLRLKMVSENTAVFNIESTKGVGTHVLVKIPADKLAKAEKS